MDISSKMNCPYCEVEIDNYESHEKPNLISKESFSCNNCDLALSNEECLERHKKIVHVMAQKVFSCEVCNRVTPIGATLEF